MPLVYMEGLHFCTPSAAGFMADMANLHFFYDITTRRLQKSAVSHV